MRTHNDSGVSVAELLVTISILMVVLSMVYYATEAIQISAEVSDRQSQYAQEIANPMHGMDKVLSANKAIENSGGFTSDAYRLTTRTTVIEGSNAFQRYVYSANADGTLTEDVYRQALGSATSTLLRSRVWTTNNANQEKGPLFTYLAADGTQTTPNAAQSVLVKIWIRNGDEYFNGERQIYFRNR
ncbi:MAG TPA: hypothetical protein VLA05_03195 [Coriobacteriia bacterium]|nr:hypothetical protein [Coriobacteriia bacterium]